MSQLPGLTLLFSSHKHSKSLQDSGGVAQNNLMAMCTTQCHDNRTYVSHAALTQSFSYASCAVFTLLSSGSGLLKDTYSVPTQETIPKPFGLTPAAGVSVSSLSFSTACKGRVSPELLVHVCQRSATDVGRYAGTRLATSDYICKVVSGWYAGKA